MAVDTPPPDTLRRWQRVGYGAGAVGLALCGAGMLLSPDSFFRSYLWAYCYFLGIALGSMVLVMVQFLTGGVWGLVIRRAAEAAMRTLPVLALLYLPIAIGFLIPSRSGEGSTGHSLPAISTSYIWTDPAFVEQDHAQELKVHYYLNIPFFLLRAGVCLALWSVFAMLLDRLSVALDRPEVGDREPRHLRMLSAAGLVVYGATVTVMAIDWIMSLEPHWVSSIFGPLIGIGQVLNGLAFLVVVIILASDRPPLAATVGRSIFRDLGSLLLTFVMVWAYLSFSQFLLIWSGNLPSEISYYLRRTQAGWQAFPVALAVFHFAMPFLLLLMRDVKRSGRTLIRVAALILVMRAVDLYWLIMPAHPGLDNRGVVAFLPSWTDLAAAVMVGGFWLAAFLGQVQRRPLLPTYDPRLAEARHHE